jgi:hypothetical protein
MSDTKVLKMMMKERKRGKDFQQYKEKTVD